MIDLGLGALLSEGVKATVGWFQRKQEMKYQKMESNQRIEEAKVEAKIRRLNNAQSGDIAWENLSIEQSGWKDEWFTIILSIPMIMCFVPGCVPYVERGFEALAKTPDWYRWCLFIAVGSAFGIRKIADFMSWKKGD